LRMALSRVIYTDDTQQNQISQDIPGK